jgi:hypothetical protein
MSSDNAPFWEMVGAIATAAATIVALGLPFLLQWLGERKRKAEFISAVQEILRAVEDALIAFHSARALTDDWTKTGQWADRIRDGGASAESACVIDHLMQRRDLTDQVVRCGTDGSALGKKTAEALALGYGENAGGRLDAFSALNAIHTRALRTIDQVLNLRETYRLGLSQRLSALQRQWRTGELANVEALCRQE